MHFLDTQQDARYHYGSLFAAVCPLARGRRGASSYAPSCEVATAFPLWLTPWLLYSVSFFSVYSVTSACVGRGTCSAAS